MNFREEKEKRKTSWGPKITCSCFFHVIDTEYYAWLLLWYSDSTVYNEKVMQQSYLYNVIC